MMRVKLIALLASMFPMHVLALPVQLQGRVVGVSDGDTITLLDSSEKEHRIRLAEIDAPEKAQAHGKRAKQTLSGIIYGRPVSASCPVKDRYDRKVCRVTVNGQDVNLAMVRSGMAWAYGKYAKDPAIFKAEALARKDRAGLWTYPNPIEPWLWRQKSGPERVANLPTAP